MLQLAFRKTLAAQALIAALVLIAGLTIGSGSVVVLAVLLIVLLYRATRAQRRNSDPLEALSGSFGGTIAIVVALLAAFNFLRVLTVFAGWANEQPLWLNITLTLVVVGSLHLASAYVYSLCVARLMSRTGSSSTNTQANTQAGIQAAAVPEPPTKAEQRTAWTAQTLTFETLDSASATTLSVPLAAKALNATARVAYRALIRAIVANFIVTIALAWYLIEDPRDLIAWSVMQLVPVGLALTIATISYFQRLRVGWLVMLVCLCVANLWNLLLLMSRNDADGGFLFSEALPSTFHYFLPAAAFIAVLGTLLILASVHRSRSAAAKSGSQGIPVRLLILRVFGFDKNTASLFRRIALRWQNIGPVFTIVDSTFARVEFARGRSVVLLLALLPLVFILALLGFDPAAAKAFVTSLPAFLLALYIPLLIVYFAYRWSRLRYCFARNREGIQQRIAFEAQTEGVLVKHYQQGKIFCFDDTWKAALGDLVACTDVVLMDLRDFDAKNLGVTYELRHLADNFAFDRVLFIIDTQTDQILLKKLLQDAWQQTLPDSPNRKKPAPVVTLYDAGQTLRGDTTGIITLLSRAVSNMANDFSAPANSHGSLEQTARTNNRRVYAAWLVVITGFVLNVFFQADGMLVYSGVSVVWIGAIAVLWTTRTRALLQRDGHCTNRFRGFPWPQVFWFVLAAWFFLYVYSGLMNPDIYLANISKPVS